MSAGPFERARGVTSIRMTAMIGTELSATPTATDRTCPIASPTGRRYPRTAPGRVSAQITQMSRAITRIDQNG
jgi:hypothetical protein